MMNILGISAFYHDSAACLVRDGEIVCAAQEERFTRKKHDAAFPKNAAAWCLRDAGAKIQDIDIIAFYDKPWLKFERILQTYLTFAPRGITSFMKAIPLWLKEKLWMKEAIRKELEGFEGKILFPEHHESHAASAFYPSPYPEAAFLTIDGVGEWATASYGVGRGNQIKILEEIHFPHSLGLLYTAFTYYLGFKVNSGEYKVMGLAPYGEPRYKDLIFKELVDLKEDGSFQLHLKYFDYCVGLKMINKKFGQLFGLPARRPETKLTQQHMDIARSVQEVTEEIVLKMGRHIHRKTGLKKLCMAGGVALNCVANGRLLREGPFEDIWIQPAAGDAGGALGAALLAWHQYLQRERTADEKNDAQRGSLLGPAFTREQIRDYLEANQIPFRELSEEELPQKVSGLIAEEKVIGWFQGRMEFGPRALGARSILGDSRSSKMQSVMNLKIKFRESFRPFAPSVLREKVNDYFEMDKESPYMLLVAPVREAIRRPMTPEQSKLFGIEKLNVVRSTIPAVTHVDYSARVQTVDGNSHPLYYQLLKVFEERQDCGVIVNTSFNVRGEPLVCRPEEAYLCFMRTEMDYLVLGNFLLDKREQKPLPKDESWMREFELD
ncbi:MAG: carbamoyltransferase [Deltaproteobacteria bacterium]|nr:carbamoyltransferase [Deltaproteobacteria bacterium]